MGAGAGGDGLEKIDEELRGLVMQVRNLKITMRTVEVWMNFLTDL
jgi:hypothetical protein